MFVRVMGRVEVLHDGVARGVQGRTQRALLSLLVLRLRVWTPASLMVEALWPGDRSERAFTRLHVQIHRLRRQLGHGVLINSAGGYRLDLTPESIDAWHFERSARSALTEAAPTHDLGALRRLEAAASQWDGAPFPGVELPDTVTWQSELADLYTRVQVKRAEAHLELGAARAPLDIATQLSREQPENVRAHVLQMSALQQTGRDSEPPRAFGEVNRPLPDLGLEPRPDLLAAQRDLACSREAEIRSELAVVDPAGDRSEERRVGKECRSRGVPCG